ncbi:CbiQ family ECF transporter T component [Variovorax sp. HJSM1_2]|uniref:CbiQ family ECF transporter T component n=1 Tax=Variovorax sp. HJSM1_2 TaxID=3366263 RepID=UPI003BDEB38C
MGSLYSERQTWLHRLPAGAKLAALALLTTLLFWLQDLRWLAGVALACTACWLSMGRAAMGARRPVVAALVASGLIIGFHAALGQPSVGVASGLRLLGACCLGACLTLSTRFQDLLSIFERLLRPLRRFGVDSDRLALMLALMLRFAEHFFVQWQRLDEAYRLRTGKSGGIKILAPLCIQMLLAARRVADALEARLGR